MKEYFPDWIQLTCPQTKQPLILDEGYLRSESNKYTLKSIDQKYYVNFLVDAQLPDDLSLQKRLYEAENQRYYSKVGVDQKYFMQMFIRTFLDGAVKGKNRLAKKYLTHLNLNSGASILEMGCNDGRFLNVATSLFNCKGAGIDISEYAIENAIRSQYDRISRNYFFVAEASSLPFADEMFDAIISFDVFEHLGHVRFMETIEQAFRTLKKGGKLCIYVVSQKDRFCLHEAVRRVSQGRFGNDAAEGHSYENFIHPDFFKSIVTEAGFKKVRVQAYHAFWSLLADELLAGKPSRWQYRIFELLDWPLTRLEYGNGFFALMEK